MDMFTIILACISVAAGSPTVKTWTLDELSTAIQLNQTDNDMKPYLADALNMIMLAIFTGENSESIQALIPSPSGGSQWTHAELNEAIKDPTTNDEFRRFMRRALHYLEFNKDQKSVEVFIPALDISTWTMSELNEAISSRATHPELVTYLEQAKTELNKDSDKRDKITIVTPVGLIKNKESTLLSRKW
ncbi:uncharacterized protein LOC115448514 [Manduca sexta]|nr:uncharacterized protein LOC115448514 [Manduca sexta]XP_030031821.1 uncharacterized protein LOC115448514 [Manduca sexta]